MGDYDLLGVAVVIAFLWVVCWGGVFCALYGI